LRQFDVFENPNPESRRYAPYAAVLQSHHLDVLETVVLAPLVNDAQRNVTSVDIPVELGGQRFVLVLGELAGLPRQGLGRPVGSLANHEDEIRRALERIFTGF
jgi:toxin CcdB